MKNNKGISIISFILTIFIFILIIFLCYEFFVVDIFDLNLRTSQLENTKKINENIYTNYKNLVNTNENILVIEPIIDDNNLRI